MKAREINSCVCLLLLLCYSSSCSSQGLGKPKQLNKVKRETIDRSDDRLYYLDNTNPKLSQPIDPARDQVGDAKFVQVEVAEVVNPKRYGLTFDVYYEPSSDAKIQLGTFTLYPADNPGKFIVPTQGKVRNEGTIVLSMVITDKMEANDQVKVGIKRIRFVKAQ